MLDIYGMSRDDFVQSMPEFLLSGEPDLFKALPSNTKSAFTREYNRTDHKSQALHSDIKKLVKNAILNENELVPEDLTENVDKEESEDEDAKQFQKPKKETKVKGQSGKRKSTSSATVTPTSSKKSKGRANINT